VEDLGPCASQPCPNGGACSPQGSGYTCGWVDPPPYTITANERGEIDDENICLEFKPNIYHFKNKPVQCE